MRSTLAVLAVLAMAMLTVASLAVAAPAHAHTLSYKTAKKAAQQKADKIAGKRTRVATMLRQNRHSYYAQAKWTRVVEGGCKGCDFDPVTGEMRDTDTTESCFVSLKVRYRSHSSRKPVARVEDRMCA